MTTHLPLAAPERSFPMRKGYLYFLVGLWTLLLGGLAVWSTYGIEWLAPGTRVVGGHLVAENAGLVAVWLLMVAGTLLASIPMARAERERAQFAATLAASEERWRSAVVAVGDGLWDWNIETDGAFFSPTGLAMYGFAPGEIPGRMEEWRTRVHAGDLAATMTALEQHLTGQTETYQTEHRIRCKDGSYKWTLARGRVVAHAPDGRPRRMIGTNRDLTRIHEAEQRLRDSEARYRHLLTSITDYVFTVEMCEGRPGATTHSPGCLAVTGYAPAEFAAHASLWFDLVPVEHRALVNEHWTAALAGKLVPALEHRIRHKDGSIRWVRGTLVPRLDAAGKLVAFDGLVQDVTESKRMESDLRESEARYRLIAENTGDVIWLLDLAANRFSYVSPSLVKLCGITPDEALQLGLDRAVPPEFLAQVNARLAARIAALAAGDESARTRAYELPLQKADGSVVETEVVTTLIAGPGGRVTHLQGTTRDITVRKRAEAELQRTRQWLEHTQRISRVGGWAFDLSTGTVWASPEARRIYGFGDGELTRADVADVPLPESRPVLDGALRDLVERGVPYDLEFQIRRRTDGAILDLHSLAERGSDGNSVIGVIQDVTDQKRAGRALRESEARLTATLGAINDLIFVLDAGGRFVEAHCPPGVPLVAAPEVFLGRPYATVLPPPVAAQLTESLRALAIAGEAQHFDYELSLHGATTWWSASITRRDAHAGGAAGAVVVCRDITARKRAERALRESEEKFYQAFHHAPLLMVVSNLADGRILEANALAQKVSGFDPKTGLGRSVVDLGWFTAAERARLVELLRSQGHVTDLELVGRKRDGTAIDCLVNCQLVTIGGETRVITTLQDITGRKRSEAALRDSEHMLRESQRVAALGSYVLDIATGNWRSSAILDEIFGIDAAFERSTVGWTSLVAPAERAAMADYFAREVLARGIQFDRQYRIVRPSDGVERWVHGIGKLEFDAARRPVRMLGTVQDITERKRAELALRESEERYRTLVELSPEAIFVHDHGIVLFANRAAAQLAGVSSPQELLGLNALDFVHPESREIVGERIRNLDATSGVAPPIRQKWHRVNGEVIELAVMATPVTFDGAPATLSIATDITVQRLAEAELRKLSRAVEQSPVTVVITDAAGAIEYVNPSFTAKTGYTLDEVRGTNSRILRSGETSPEMYRDLWRTILSGREWRGEFHNRKKNGELFWEAATLSPIFDDAGQITHFLAVKEDITARKLAEDRIREQAALLDVTQDAILVLDLDRVITYWNRGAEKLYGIGREQAVGRRYETIAYREVPADYDTEWRNFLERGVWSVERRHAASGRGEITVQKRATLVCDAAGRATSVLLVITDITEAKRLEAQFLRAQRLDSLGSLASGVAHDLNNVLTPILMSAGILADSARTKAERELIQMLGDSARRGADIVQQLLLYGRGSDSPRSPISVAAAIKDMLKMMRETFPKGLEISAEVPKDLWMIDGDRTQLHQVLLNLCVNARDAMPARGALSVQAENVNVDPAFAARQANARPGPHVTIRVKDTGAGIPAAHLEKIFDPFFTTKPTGKGTGLGLATVLGIVRSHGGFVTVETQEGVGSEFAVFIPARTSSVESAASGPSRPVRRGRGEVILVIDDEVSIRSTLAKILTAHDYEVLVAGDGAEGLAVFAQNSKKIRLVVTDMMMPVMDGTQAVGALRRLNPRLPIIAISGVPGQRAELEASFGPHIRFLPKPFLVEKALSLARELLDEPVVPAGGPLPAARK